jgi:hypothetical protein
MGKMSLLGLLAVFAACAAFQSVQGADKAEASKIRTLRKGATCNVRTPRRVAVTDQNAYVTLWNGIFGAGPKDGRTTPPTQVDFKKEMVLAAFMGEQNTGGYAVEIKDAVEEKGKLVVTVLERSPGPDSIVTQAFTTPFYLAAVKRSALPVQWKVVSTAK